VADAFCGSRLGTSYGGTFGMLTSGSLRAIVQRATPTP
jgi:putative acyl-CoA dehydrogenase